MSENKPDEFTLAQELRELGQQIEQAVRVAREHPQTKEFERQVSQAVKELGTHIDRALKAAQEDDRVRTAAMTAEEEFRHAAQKFEASGAKADIERGLAKGLRVLNEQIRRAVAEADKTKPHDGEPPSGGSEQS